MAATAPISPELYEKTQKIDLYRLRATEYLQRYEKMRDLEWKVLFQTYAGYAGIAATCWHIHGLQWEMPHRAMIGTFIFFLATQYLSLHIQERLLNFDATYESWMKQICALVGADANFDPGPGTKKLWHKYTWTYHTQLLLASLTSVSLLLYEAGLAHDRPGTLLAWLNVLIVICGLSLGCYAERRRRQSDVNFRQTKA